MSNLTTSTAGDYTANNTTWYGMPCAIHGSQSCSCYAQGGNPNALQSQCAGCGAMYPIGGLHACPSPTYGAVTICSNCGQAYSNYILHSCPAAWTTSPSWTGTSTSTWTPNAFHPSFKEVKEITTDKELIYEWNGNTFNMRLPSKFGDCFLKVGYTWSPLYPLIFSAFDNDSKELSFHLVTGITDKTFEGDEVVLRAVSTTKIEDNLTLLQLSNRVKEYFKDDSPSTPAHE